MWRLSPTIPIGYRGSKSTRSVPPSKATERPALRLSARSEIGSCWYRWEALPLSTRPGSGLATTTPPAKSCTAQPFASPDSPGPDPTSKRLP